MVLTGPTRGLGLEAARAIVARAPRGRLALLGRPGPTFDGVTRELSAPDRLVEAIGCDFASLTQIRDAAARVRELVAAASLGSIDALVLNAGIQTIDRLQRSTDGFELTFAPQRSGSVLADMAPGRRFGHLRGGYVDIDQERRASDDSYDAERERQLWDVLEELVAPTPR